jgi:hypothetical protein
MAIVAGVLSGDRAWFCEQRVRFWLLFDTARPVAYPLLSEQDKQTLLLLVIVDVMAIMTPSDPELQGVFETQLARLPVGEQRRLSHDRLLQALNIRVLTPFYRGEIVMFPIAHATMPSPLMYDCSTYLVHGGDGAQPERQHRPLLQRKRPHRLNAGEWLVGTAFGCFQSAARLRRVH